MLNCFIFGSDGSVDLHRVLRREYLDTSFESVTHRLASITGVYSFVSERHLEESAKLILQSIHCVYLHNVYLMVTHNGHMDFLRQATYGHLVEQMTIPLTYLSDLKTGLRKIAADCGSIITDTGDCEDGLLEALHTYMGMRYLEAQNEYNEALFKLHQMYLQTAPAMGQLHVYRFEVDPHFKPLAFASYLTNMLPKEAYESLCFPG